MGGDRTKQAEGRLGIVIARWMCAAALVGLVVSGAVGQGSPAASAVDSKTDEVILPGAAYEVATIKPHSPNAAWGGGFGTRSNAVFYTKGQPLKYGVCNAYDVFPYQCLGGPAWFESDLYDIEAKPDNVTTEQLLKLGWKERWSVEQRMQQALLADRLKLKVHYETREMPIFALVVAKGGLKMHEAKPGDTYENGLKEGNGKALGAGASYVGNGKIVMQGMSMDALATQLSGTTSHIVQNKTGLPGLYNIRLQYADSDSPPPDSTAPSIYTAIEEQLGLKLKTSKGPVRVLVIDHVERPSEN
jgi:uncharacterized protein (TIGR03435 family)